MKHYILFGAYASYYTAKVRVYLRKKGIPFVERLPSDPVFRDTVRPASGTHRIPQVLTPAGEVLQDSVFIVDALEPDFPAIPAFPDTPKQRVFVHLMELFGSEGLLSLAWQHRWLFPENEPFITRDFGRTFRPQGNDADLLKLSRHGGLNLYVINGIAPEIPLKTILKGSLPYVACMVVAILILCLFPGIATWLPDVLMGTAVS